MKAVLEAKPDVVVLINSWGFTLRVAQGVRRADPSIKLVKYIGPQVWATRAGRAKTLAEAVDHLICIHDFEAPYYEPFGWRARCAAIPPFGRFKPGSDGRLSRRATPSPRTNACCLCFPGSRPAEIRRIGPVLWRAADLLRAGRGDLRLAMVAAQAVHHAAVAQAPERR